MPKATVNILLLALLLAGPATAQESIQRAETGFERDANRLRWLSDAHYERTMGKWSVYARNRFMSEAFSVRGTVTGFRDEDMGEFRVLRAYSERAQWSLRGRTGWFSQNSAFTQELYAGIRFQPSAMWWLEPSAGFAWDRRQGTIQEDGSIPLRLDSGPAFGLHGAYRNAAFYDYNVDVSTRGTWQFINPRQSRAFQVGGTALRTFDKIDVRLDAAYASFRRDNYQAASFLNRSTTPGGAETIESTSSDTLDLGVELRIPINDRWSFESRAAFSGTNRFIRALQSPDDALFFNTDYNRRLLELDATTAYSTRRIRASLTLAGGATVERRSLTNAADLPQTQAIQKGQQLRQADFDRGRLQVRGRFQAELSDRLSLRANGAANISRQDTPEFNDNDRDEVFDNGEVGLLFKLSEYVDIDASLFGTYFHTVNLKASRSAENNKQRSIRFRPLARWRPGYRTLIEAGGEVRATYTVDDFEIEGRTKNDQSAREIRYLGEIDHTFQDGQRLRISGSFSDLHLGRLLWEEFQEIPFDTLRTYSVWGRLQVGRPWTVEVGVRTFVRRDFGPRTTIRYPRVDANGQAVTSSDGTEIMDTITRVGREWIEQIGPTSAIEWPMSRDSALRIDGWLQWQRIRQTLFGSIPEESEAAIREAGRTGTVRLVPNISMTVIWNF